MLVELDVDGLVVGDVHEVDRGAARADDGEVGGVLGVVEAVQRAVFDAEAVIPEVQDAALRFSRCGGRGAGVGNHGGGGVVAAEGDA